MTTHKTTHIRVVIIFLCSALESRPIISLYFPCILHITLFVSFCQSFLRIFTIIAMFFISVLCRMHQPFFHSIDKAYLTANEIRNVVWLRISSFFVMPGCSGFSPLAHGPHLEQPRRRFGVPDGAVQNHGHQFLQRILHKIQKFVLIRMRLRPV